MKETIYYKFPDGSVAQETVETGGGVIVDPVPPPGAVIITAAEYQVLVAALEMATELLLEALHTAEQTEKGQDFAALIAAGIPPPTARRLTGYQADDDSGLPGVPPILGEQS